MSLAVVGWVALACGQLPSPPNFPTTPAANPAPSSQGGYSAGPAPIAPPPGPPNLDATLQSPGASARRSAAPASQPPHQFQPAQPATAPISSPAGDPGVAANQGGYNYSNPNNGAIVPANFTESAGQQPGARIAAPAASTTAETLLLTCLQDIAQYSSGNPWRLQDVLANSPPGRGAIPAVVNYWRLTRDACEYAWAKREQQYLSRLRKPTQPLEKAMLAAEIAAATVRVAEHERDAEQAWGLRESGWPKPADPPYAILYNTLLEKLPESAPASLRRLGEGIPTKHRLLAAQADAVQAYQNARDQHAQAGALVQALEMHERLRKQRREFLQTVYLYNRDIAEYALSVSSPRLPQQRVVRMLVEPSATARLAGGANRTR